ncbi:Uncharacterised protein [Fusobacterium necrogenes]|uniref:Lipoprotein n=1 Tax=Fusobacterium necrogenes TaxID=858 RepID=A0A377GVH1_9FUSO|nr:hypothetical protein [Fusobacterium necrogenes]STO30949.1 Uncharacterised protein [Fusobacterium necrogenes]
MKKFIFIFILTIFFISGCTSINTLINEALPTKSSTIPVALQEQIATKINPENELFAVGHANIDKSGSLLAQAKANKNAKEALKVQIKKEVKVNFNVFMMNIDNYSKGIISPVLSDLTDYAVDLGSKHAVQKGAWENDSAVYSLFAVDRDKIVELSKEVFTGYLGDISGKLNNIKSKIGNIELNNSSNFTPNDPTNEEVIE